MSDEIRTTNALSCLRDARSQIRIATTLEAIERAFDAFSHTNFTESKP